MSTTTARSTVTSCPACGRRNRVPATAGGRPRCASCSADLPWLADAGDADFGAVVEQSPLPVLVDVWAPWCGPCRMVSPAVEQLARDRAGRLKVVKVNADEAPQTARRLRVSGIPTLLLFSGGTERDRVVGAQPAASIQRWVDGRLG